MFGSKKKCAVFERENVKKSIQKAKEVRAVYDDKMTDKDCEERIKKECEEMSAMLTTSIKAMQTILYDL